MYRRILVPIDGSATAALGFKHALGLAREQGARLRMINVLDTLVMAPMADGYAAADMSVVLDSMEAGGRKALAEAARLAERAGVKADTVMADGRAGYVSDAILECARDWRADLIVMGTHGRRGLNRLLLGSDAERVLRESPAPLLLVRAPEGAGGRAARTKPRGRTRRKAPK